MLDPTELSRRERQIMDVVFSLGEATVNQVVERLPDPPTPMAVRRMMHILEEKKYVVRRQEGREMVYRPAQSKSRVGVRALQHVIDTFFGGAVDEALAAHFSRRKSISPEQIDRIKALIDEARAKEEEA
jgi:predicted transcriptional regulator